MRRAAALALILAAGAAGALTPPAPCRYDPDAARFLTGDEPDRPGQVEVLPETFASGIVFYRIAPGGPVRQVVEHCPTGAGLVVDTPAGADDLRARLAAMVFGADAVTLDEAAATMRALGAGVRTGPPGLGDCPCSHQRFFFGG